MWSAMPPATISFEISHLSRQMNQTNVWPRFRSAAPLIAPLDYIVSLLIFLCVTRQGHSIGEIGRQLHTIYFIQSCSSSIVTCTHTPIWSQTLTKGNPIAHSRHDFRCNGPLLS